MKTVEQLNDIQSQWMALDSEDSEQEKKRVFALMDTLPSVHISYDAGSQKGTVLINGSSIVNRHLSLLEAIDLCIQYEGRTDLYWNCKGEWESLDNETIALSREDYYA